MKNILGDALNGLLLLEDAIARAYMAIHPSQMYLSRNVPETGTDITLPKQALVILNAFVGRV